SPNKIRSAIHWSHLPVRTFSHFGCADHCRSHSEDGGPHWQHDCAPRPVSHDSTNILITRTPLCTFIPLLVEYTLSLPLHLRCELSRWTSQNTVHESDVVISQLHRDVKQKRDRKKYRCHDVAREAHSQSLSAAVLLV